MTQQEKAFLLLAEELNFSRAAARAYITQQGLSDHIRRLEASCGMTLFNRRPVVSLTEAGLAMQRALLKIEAMERGLEEELGELQHGARGTLRIGINNVRAKLILPALFTRFHERYPHVRIECAFGENNQIHRLLQENKVDFYLGVNDLPEKDCAVVPLRRETIYLVATGEYIRRHLGRDAQTAGGREISLTELSNLPMAMNFSISTLFRLISQQLQEHGVRVENLFSSSDYDILSSISRKGTVATFCPQFYVSVILRNNAIWPQDQKLYVLPVRELREKLRFEIIYRRDTYLPAYMGACFEMISDTVRELYSDSEELMRSYAAPVIQ